MAKIYWLHGQPGSGKTTIGKRLQIWLQTDKVNWRKTVFHIDEVDIKKISEDNNLDNVLTICKFLVATNHDVVVSVPTPKKLFRDKIKSDTKVVEIYCHTKNKIGKEKQIILEYETPDHTFISLDTTGEIESNFERLIKMLV